MIARYNLMSNIPQLDYESQYSYIFPFEKNFSPESALNWLIHQEHVAYYLCILYITSIFGLKQWMSNSKPFLLEKPLIYWNLALSVFSIAAFCRTVPEFYRSLRDHGYYYSICDPSNIVHDKVSSFWTFLFVLSKLFEFGDTFFLVLRKRPLIFLHWYHHTCTFIMAWYLAEEATACLRWIIVLNTFVHSLMYPYYTVKQIGISLPKLVSMVLTSLQIFQMIVGIIVTLAMWYYIFIPSSPCAISKKNLCYCFTISLSYLLLFVRYFRNTYLKSQDKTTKNR